MNLDPDLKHCFVKIIYCQQNDTFLEAVRVEGHLALLAHEHCLQVRPLAEGAEPAVSAPGLPFAVQLLAHNPVILAIKPENKE